MAHPGFIICWRGNSGYLFPEPDTVLESWCGMCGTKMRVRRNVLGPTCFAAAMAGHKRLHDSFFCPHYGKEWHDKIEALKRHVYEAEINRSSRAEVAKLKRSARREILRLLKTHRVR